MAKSSVKRKHYDAGKLETRFNKPGDPEQVIYPEKVHIYRVSSTNEDNLVVQFFDGNKLVFEINKKDLHDSIAIAMAVDYDSKGISYKIPRYEYAIEIDYIVEHKLTAVGDVDGIIFWLEGNALG